jgi:hypothetical protein
VTSFLGDLLVLWLGLTAACSVLLAAVVGVQAAWGRARRSRSARRRRAGRGRSPAGPPARVVDVPP